MHTGKGFFLGSAPWSSPEQAMGEEVDARSDLYSVGIILYELLTGSRPFNGPFGRQIYDHIHTPPPPFAKINPSLALPPRVEQVVLRCLAKKPGDRPQTALDLCADFLWAASDGKGTPSASRLIPPFPLQARRSRADRCRRRLRMRGPADRRAARPALPGLDRAAWPHRRDAAADRSRRPTGQQADMARDPARRNHARGRRGDRRHCPDRRPRARDLGVGGSSWLRPACAWCLAAGRVGLPGSLPVADQRPPRPRRVRALSARRRRSAAIRPGPDKRTRRGSS